MRTIIVYDVSTLPKGTSAEEVNTFLEEKGILLWDSKSTGVEPLIVAIAEEGISSSRSFLTEEYED